MTKKVSAQEIADPAAQVEAPPSMVHLKLSASIRIPQKAVEEIESSIAQMRQAMDALAQALGGMVVEAELS